MVAFVRERHAAVEGQLVNEAVEGHPADEHAEAVADVDDADGLEDLESLPDRVPADPQLLHQFELGRQWITGGEPTLQDDVLDRLLDLDSAAQPTATTRGNTSRRHVAVLAGGVPGGVMIIVKHRGHLLVICS